MNFKDEFMETMTVFFDIVVLNILFYVITLTSFSLFLIPTLFIFSNLLYRCYRKNTKSILFDLKEILKRDFYLILKNTMIQWLIFVFVMLFINNITVTIIFTAVTVPYLIVFWYLFINRTLGFFEYYKVALKITLGYPFMYLLMLIAVVLTSYIVIFMNGLFLIVFLPVGLIFLLLFLVDKKVLKLEKKMHKVKISDVNNTLENKDNKFLNIDGINTGHIEIDMDMSPEEIEHNLCYVIASVISKNGKILELVNQELLSARNKLQLDALAKFLDSSDNGVMKFESIRKDLLQFEIIAKNTKYQVEIHLGNHNFCICEDFNVVAIDAY